MADCTTIKEFKKRLVAITKGIEAITRRSEVVIDKITHLEDRGLNAKNKKYHTAMQHEKLALKERIKKLQTAKDEILDKLNQQGYEKNDNYKEEQQKRKLEKKLAKKEIKEIKKEELEIEIETKQKGKEVKEKRKAVKEQKEVKQENVNLKEKMKDIKVLDSLEPALEVPSAKDFFSGAATALSNANSVPEDESSSSEDEVSCIVSLDYTRRKLRLFKIFQNI